MYSTIRNTLLSLTLGMSSLATGLAVADQCPSMITFHAPNYNVTTFSLSSDHQYNGWLLNIFPGAEKYLKQFKDRKATHDVVYYFGGVTTTATTSAERADSGMCYYFPVMGKVIHNFGREKQNIVTLWSNDGTVMPVDLKAPVWHPIREYSPYAQCAQSDTFACPIIVTDFSKK